jgi:2-polyprenyl-3-methyl-5-hydroxy-6-metoxy-1,4-benzoquinol methylase
VNRVDDALLIEMAALLSGADRDEMAIPSYLHRNPLLRYMAWARVEAVASLVEDIALARRRKTDADASCLGRVGGPKVLDYGCGTGIIFEEALRWTDELIGVDPVLDAAELHCARSGLEGVTLLTPEGANEGVAPGSVDIIIAAEVLEHIDRPQTTIERFRHWLAPGGRLVTSLPTENRAYRFGRRLAGFEGDYHRHNAASLHGVLADLDFIECRRRRIPLPGPLAIYWVAEFST